MARLRRRLLASRGATGSLTELRLSLIHGHCHLLVHEGTRRVQLAAVTFSCVRTAADHCLQLVRTTRLELRQGCTRVVKDRLAGVAGCQVRATEVPRLLVKANIIFTPLLVRIYHQGLGR